MGVSESCRDSPRQPIPCLVQFVSLNVLINVLSRASQSAPTGESKPCVGKPLLLENSLEKLVADAKIFM